MTKIKKNRRKVTKKGIKPTTTNPRKHNQMTPKNYKMLKESKNKPKNNNKKSPSKMRLSKNKIKQKNRLLKLTTVKYRDVKENNVWIIQHTKQLVKKSKRNKS